VGFFVADICAFEAFLLIGPRLTLLLQSLTPPVAALVSWMALGEELHARHWLAMAVTLLGVAWVVLERPDEEAGTRSPRTLRLGVFLATVSAIGMAVGTVLSKQGLHSYDAVTATVVHYDAVSATFIRVLGGIAGFAVLTTCAWRWPAVLSSVAHGRAMAVILFGSLVGPFLGVVLMLVALSRCEAGIVTTILSITPVLILPFAVLVHRERVSLRATLGAFLSVAGVVLFFV
jgi:drug/metabolite transporter (DMT)-like permease